MVKFRGVAFPFYVPWTHNILYNWVQYSLRSLGNESWYFHFAHSLDSGINKLILLVFPPAFDRFAVFTERNNPRIHGTHRSETTCARREIVYERI